MFLFSTLWTLKLRDGSCWCLCKGETYQSSFVQPMWDDVSSNRTPVESCQTTMSRVKTVGWQDRVCQDLPNVILLVFVTVCVLAGVSLCMCMYMCLTIKFRGCSHWMWNSRGLHSLLSIITNLSCAVCSSLYILHFVALQMLVKFSGTHSLSFFNL